MKDQTITKITHFFTVPDADLDALDRVTELLNSFAHIDNSLLEIAFDKFMQGYYDTPYNRQSNFIQELDTKNWEEKFNDLRFIMEILSTMFENENQAAYEEGLDNEEEEEEEEDEEDE